MRRTDSIRLYLLLGAAAFGVALQAVDWPRAFGQRLTAVSDAGLRATAMKGLLQPLSRKQGGVYLERPDEFLYFHTSYYAYPRPVYITDEPGPINGNDDILAAAVPLTEQRKKQLRITSVVVPNRDGLDLVELE